MRNNWFFYVRKIDLKYDIFTQILLFLQQLKPRSTKRREIFSNTIKNVKKIIEGDMHFFSRHMKHAYLY